MISFKYMQNTLKKKKTPKECKYKREICGIILFAHMK